MFCGGGGGGAGLLFAPPPPPTFGVDTLFMIDCDLFGGSSVFLPIPPRGAFDPTGRNLGIPPANNPPRPAGDTTPPPPRNPPPPSKVKQYSLLLFDNQLFVLFRSVI